MSGTQITPNSSATNWQSGTATGAVIGGVIDNQIGKDLDKAK